jgi:hypothetical protein
MNLASFQQDSSEVGCALLGRQHLFLSLYHGSSNSRITRIVLIGARGLGCHRLAFGILKLMELIFEIRDAEEGGFCARALGHAIFTEGETWEELRANVLEAVSLHFEDARERPRLVQMHYVKDELIPVEAA